MSSISNVVTAAIETAITTETAADINSAAAAINELPAEEFEKIVAQLKSERPPRQPHIAAVRSYERGACHPVRGGSASGK